MGYPQPPAAPGRPTTVTAAVIAMFILAGLQLLAVPVTLSVAGPTEDAARATLGTGAEADTFVTTTMISIYVGVAVGILFAVGWTVLALLDMRGKQVARIITWVLGGLFLCCVSFGLASTAVGNALGGSGTINGVSQTDLQRAIEDAQPSYVQPLSIASYVVEAVLVLAVIILLALPASNEFFRKRPESIWEPPVPGTPYSPS